MMTVGSLFSGIGGMDTAFTWAGMQVSWQVEIDPWCQDQLAKKWPMAKRYGDIRAVNANELAPVHVIAAGAPCQPISVAGERQGEDDDRYLWPETLQAVASVRPAWFVGENPPGLIGMGLDGILSDLEGLGYACWPCVVPACAVGSPQIRERVWIVAYTDTPRLPLPQHAGEQRAPGEGAREEGPTAEQLHSLHIPCVGHADHLRAMEPQGDLCEGWRWPRNPGAWDDTVPVLCHDGEYRRTKPGLGLLAHGLSGRVPRLKAFGNAVVPEVVYRIARRISEVSRACGVA